MMMAMANEKTRKPNSEAHACNVYPRILRPWEWRENLNMRKTRNTRRVTNAPDTSLSSDIVRPM